MTVLLGHAVGNNLLRTFGQLEFVGGGEPAASSLLGALAFFVLVAFLLSFFLGPHREWLNDLGSAAAADFLFEFFDALRADPSCRCKVAMTSIKRSTMIFPSATSRLSCALASMPRIYQTDRRTAAPVFNFPRPAHPDLSRRAASEF